MSSVKNCFTQLKKVGIAMVHAELKRLGTKRKIPSDMEICKTHKTNLCGFISIVCYESSRSVKVKFKDTKSEVVAQSSDVRKGNVRDPMMPTVHSVGFIGVGKHSSRENKKTTKKYKVWASMIERGYSEKFKKKHPSYIDCTVAKIWHNFQNFAEWFECNQPKGSDCQLDKDLLVFDNKLYSPATCVFLPRWLNTFTLSSEARTGKYPLGVSWHKSVGAFSSNCRKEGGLIHLGYYQTPEKAHEAWLSYKLTLAFTRKPEMDKIDLRIYPNVVQIIKEAR